MIGRELTVYARERWGPLGGAFVDLMGETHDYRIARLEFAAFVD
jgi:hypothetical protein